MSVEPAPQAGALPRVTLRRFAVAVSLTVAIGIGLATAIHVYAGKTGRGHLWGLVAGAAVGLVLLGSLPLELKRFLGGDGGKRHLGFAGFLIFVKYPLVLLLLYPLLVWKWVDPLEFVFGFAIVQAAVIGNAIAFSWRHRSD
ncbi:MAG: hypothetical protein HY303_10640 [Candidatus Wallbacteria bacterium]|nr:hypothetical protein [Candidatus Wallbacteria bacterium]